MFAVLFLLTAISWILAYRLRSEVNAKLVPPQRSEVWPSWRYWRMLRLHQELYPSSRLRLAVYLCHLSAFVWLVLMLLS
jgi:hypothetical protein